MLQPESTAVTYALPAVPVNSAVPSCTSMAERVNVISCVLVCATTSPAFHVAEVAAGKRHFSPFSVVSGLGGSAVCAARTAGSAAQIAAAADRRTAREIRILTL